jgi:hypothetical protein
MCLVIATPYIGIDHDARLYMVGALHDLNPAFHARDPWFLDASQDRWTLFSPMLAQIVRLFDIEGGALAATVLQGFVFLVAAYWFSHAALRGPASLLLFLALVTLPLCFSPKGMLFIREGFVSARMFGIGFSLFGLTCCLQGRAAAAVHCHGIALAIHPIMAVGPAAVSVLLHRSPGVQATLGFVGAALLAGVFAAAGSTVLPVMDADWWAYVDLAVLVSVGEWVGASLPRWLSLFCLLIVAGRYGTFRLRGFYRLVALVSAVALLASVVAGIHIQVVLILQAQLWRSLWLVQVAGVVALVDLGCRHVLRRHAPYRAPGLLFIATGLLFPAWSGVALAVLAGIHQRVPRLLPALVRQLRPRKFAVAIVATSLALLALPGYLLDWAMVSGSLDEPHVVADAVEGFLRTGGYGLVPGLIWLLGRAAQRRGPVPGAVILVPLTLLAALMWDARSPERRAIESRYALDTSRSRFAGIIPRGSVVFWNRGGERVWFELGTAGYAGTLHATGMVFSRERTRLLAVRLIAVAMAYRSREEVDEAIASGSVVESLLRRGGGASEMVDPYLLAAYEALSSITPFGLGNLCRDQQLDFVVDTLFVPGVSAIPVQEEILGRRQQYFVYACKVLRENRK